jgi:hypothetical protein
MLSQQIGKCLHPGLGIQIDTTCIQKANCLPVVLKETPNNAGIRKRCDRHGIVSDRGAVD